MQVKSNRQMNIVPKQTVTIASLIWIISALAAAIAGVRGGLDELPATALFAGAALPAALTILVALRGKRWPFGRKFAVAIFPWIVFTAGIITLSGGITSPALLLVALAPLYTLAFGWKSHAVEACIFALLGLVGSLLAVLLLDTSLVGPSLGTVSGILSLGALISGAVLLAAILRRQTFMRPGGRAAAAPPTPAASDTDAPGRSGPVMIVDVAEDGRVRMVSGELPVNIDPRQKRPFIEAFRESDREKVEGALASEGTSLVLDVGKTRLELIFDPHVAGTRVFMSEAEDDTETRAADVIASDAEIRAREAETLLKERTAFFASLGHELKTPLNAILGFSDLMRNELRGELSEAYKEYVQLIYESGQDLLLTVEDILDYAKAESGSTRLDLEPVDLVASSESVIAQLSGFADRAGVSIRQKATGEVWATADARAIRQIWQNLLSNAIKYSSSGSTVSLDARAGTSTVALSVRDNGTGMSARDLEQVARPFQQGTNARGRAGTGLGLAVVKSFADLMTGKVIIDTAPGEGTRVRVILPKAVGEETETRQLEETVG